MSMSGGSTTLHTSIARGHRVWNLHPGGGFAGLGTSPGRMILSLLRSGAGTGITDRSASVYGWTGFSKSAFFEAYSAILPRYITATLSHMYLMVLRSGDMNRYVSPK